MGLLLRRYEEQVDRCGRVGSLEVETVKEEWNEDIWTTYKLEKGLYVKGLADDK